MHPSTASSSEAFTALSVSTTVLLSTRAPSTAHNATGSRYNPASAGVTMTLGILFNVVALVILTKAYNRYRQRSKATFLLLASSLVATDLAGHVITGALVLSRYSTITAESNLPGPPKKPDAPCLFLGGCMVFFGLCPLFLGCAMAAERCMGITRPLLHARLVTTARTKMILALIWFLALSVALLPFFSLGAYTYQYPWTWCFIKVMEDTTPHDLAFVTLFCSLAWSCLALAFVCNTVSGITLVRSRLWKRTCSRHCSTRSHDAEMVVQLVGIMVTSCICWSPLLVGVTSKHIQGFIQKQKSYYQDKTCADNTQNTLTNLLANRCCVFTINSIDLLLLLKTTWDKLGQSFICCSKWLSQNSTVAQPVEWVVQ